MPPCSSDRANTGESPTIMTVILSRVGSKPEMLDGEHRHRPDPADALHTDPFSFKSL
jgi:hypothetical protein